jgi:hypothetical protein
VNAYHLLRHSSASIKSIGYAGIARGVADALPGPYGFVASSASVTPVKPGVQNILKKTGYRLQFTPCLIRGRYDGKVDFLTFYDFSKVEIAESRGNGRHGKKLGCGEPLQTGSWRGRRGQGWSILKTGLKGGLWNESQTIA